MQSRHEGYVHRGVRPPVVLGLLGGVASGKSTVARLLAKQGAEVLDADRVVRACLVEPTVVRALSSRFGEAVLTPDGAIDREALARQVFGPGGEPARRDLEAILHPLVRTRLGARLRELRELPDPPWCVVLDVPLLHEGPLAEWCETLVFVESSATARRDRVVRERGWTQEELARREAAQATLDAKREAADHVVCNRGSLDDLEREVDTLVLGLRKMAADPQEGAPEAGRLPRHRPLENETWPRR